MSYNPNITTSYLPTSIYLSNEPEEMAIRLMSYLTEISLKLNLRQVGIFDTSEQEAGELWFGNTQSFRQIYQFLTIIPGTSINVPHNIVGLRQVVHFYGSILTVTPDNRPLPYVDVANVTNQVSVLVNGANIVISNGATAPQINSGIVVLEYLKN